MKFEYGGNTWHIDVNIHFEEQPTEPPEEIFDVPRPASSQS